MSIFETSIVGLGFLTIILFFYISKRYFDSVEAIRQTKLLELQINTKIDPTIGDQLDDFISNVFDDYLITATDYIQKEYISKDEEVDIRTNMCNLVGDRISPYLYQKLSLYYNESQIPDIISQRIYQLVTAFVVSKNSVKQSKDDL